jgi:hypothetical protein
MKVVLCLLLLAGLTQSETADALLAQLFDRGVSFDQFLAKASAQRGRWLKNASAASSPTDLVDRLKHASEGLQFLIVAEDWCPDSVNTVPWIARLAASAGDDVRIVDRSSGDPLMKRHRTPDGRTATPTVVLIRHGRDVGAWVERPAVLQRLFLSIATSPAAAKEFADRQAWYDADGGRTTLAEVVALAERSAGAQADKAWRMNVDGRLFATFNRQGGRRGGIHFRSQNWFMAMAFPEIVHRPHPGERPVSFHVFMWIGRAALEGRMWNTTMAGPSGMGGMAHHH